MEVKFADIFYRASADTARGAAFCTPAARRSEAMAVGEATANRAVSEMSPIPRKSSRDKLYLCFFREIFGIRPASKQAFSHHLYFIELSTALDCKGGRGNRFNSSSWQDSARGGGGRGRGDGRGFRSGQYTSRQPQGIYNV